MRKYIIIVGFMIIALNIKAQDSTYKHFDISTSAMYWSPLSVHLSGDYYTPGNLFSKFAGFGNTIAPTINMIYYFKSNIGISVAYNYMAFEETQDEYKNIAEIHNLRFGISGRVFEKPLFGLSFSTGINFVPNYNFKMPMRFSNPQGMELNAKGFTYGAYFNAGFRVRIYKGLSFITSFDYTYIPVELNYSATYQNYELVQIEKTNLSGIGIQTGLSFIF